MSKQEFEQPKINMKNFSIRHVSNLRLTRRELLQLGVGAVEAAALAGCGLLEPITAESEIKKTQKNNVEKLTREFVNNEFFSRYGVNFSDPDERDIDVAVKSNGRYRIVSFGETGPKINSHQALGIEVANVYHKDGSLSSSKINVNTLFGGQLIAELSPFLYILGRDGKDTPTADLIKFARVFFNLPENLQWNRYSSFSEEDGSQKIVIESGTKLPDGRMIDITATTYGELSLSVISPQKPTPTPVS